MMRVLAMNLQTVTTGVWVVGLLIAGVLLLALYL